jgi:outer membrane receptor protein involved in Fe transport
MNISKTKHLFLLTFIVLFGLNLSAQTIVKGIVIDGDTNQPLPGTNVIVEGTTKGTVSDFEGKFNIKLPTESGILDFSNMGFTTQSIPVDQNSGDLNVVMVADANQLEDIIITANKTAQSSQKVPLSVSVVGIKQLQRTGAKDFRDYAAGIPNLSFGTQGGDAGGRFSNEISIRGISGARTTAMYLNGSPLPESLSPNLIDVSRVEVLKGPQGTLYGSATMGGAIKVVTNKPNVYETSGFIEGEVSSVKEGDFNYNVQGLINVPITDKLAFRGSGYYNFRSGVYDRIVNKDIEWLNEGNPLTEDFYGDTEDYFGDAFNIKTNGCNGCSREDKFNVDDQTDYGFNANLGFYPTENLSFVATIIHQNLNGDGYDFAENDVNSFDQFSNTGLDESYKDKWTHYNLNIDWDLGMGTLTSSTSYLDRGFIETEDVSDINTYWWISYDDDPGVEPLDVIWGETVDRAVDTRIFQQEFRFASEFEGKFNFIAGIFYSNEQSDWNYNTMATGMATYLLSDNAWFSYPDPNPDYPDYEDETYWGDTEADYRRILNNNDLPWYSYKGFFETKEFALFGQFYYDITEKLKFTLGLRYFNSSIYKDINETGADFGFVESPFTTKHSDSGVNPKFNLSYQIDKDKMLYATVAKGFRLGDSNELLPFFAQEELEPGEWPANYESDWIWNYEVGFKSVWANGRFIANAAIFYNDWQNLQQYRLLDSGWGYTANVGSAHSAGFELDLKGKVTKAFELGFGMGVLDPVIDEGGENLPAEKGDKILYTASFTANGNAQYTIEFKNANSMYLRADLQHVGERLGTYTPEDNPESVYPSYTLINSRIGYSMKKAEIALFAQNLTNTQAVYGEIQSFAGNLPGRNRYSTNRPLTVGLNFRYNF